MNHTARVVLVAVGWLIVLSGAFWPGVVGWFRERRFLARAESAWGIRPGRWDSARDRRARLVLFLSQRIAGTAVDLARAIRAGTPSYVRAVQVVRSQDGVLVVVLDTPRRRLTPWLTAAVVDLVQDHVGAHVGPIEVRTIHDRIGGRIVSIAGGIQ